MMIISSTEKVLVMSVI